MEQSNPATPSSSQQHEGSFKLLTGIEIVEYLRQQAFYHGELGMSINFTSMEDIVKMMEDEIAESTKSGKNKPYYKEEPKTEKEMMNDAVDSYHRELSVLQYRQKRLQDPRNAPVVRLVEAMVDEKLRAAGRKQQSLNRKPLRKKLAELIELTHPPPERNGVTMLIHIPDFTRTKKDWLEIQLPLKAHIDEVHGMLDNFVCDHLRQQTGRTRTREEVWDQSKFKGWKYQLLSSNRTKLLRNASTVLDSDRAYAELIAQIQKAKAPPVPLLTRDGLRPIEVVQAPPKRVTKVDNGADADDLFDNEGEPVFQPVDLSSPALQEYLDSICGLDRDEEDPRTHNRETFAEIMKGTRWGD